MNIQIIFVLLNTKLAVNEIIRVDANFASVLCHNADIHGLHIIGSKVARRLEVVCFGSTRCPQIVDLVLWSRSLLFSFVGKIDKLLANRSEDLIRSLCITTSEFSSIMNGIKGLSLIHMPDFIKLLSVLFSLGWIRDTVS